MFFKLKVTLKIKQIKNFLQLKVNCHKSRHCININNCYQTMKDEIFIKCGNFKDIIALSAFLNVILFVYLLFRRRFQQFCGNIFRLYSVDYNDGSADTIYANWGEVNWWGHFSVHPEVPNSFSLAIGPDNSIFNVAVRESSVLCTTRLLPFQPKPILIYTLGLRGTS